MQIGVSTYSYRTLVENGVHTQFDLIALSSKIGFDFIEFAGLDVPAGEDKKAYAHRLQEECRRQSLAIGNYTIAADFLNPQIGGWPEEVARLQEEVKIAKILGAPGMRHDAAWGRRLAELEPDAAVLPQAKAPAESYASILPLLATACRQVSEWAARHSIRTMVENHGFLAQDSQRVEDLIAAVDCANFGVLLDIGNFLCVDEDPATAVGRLAPYAFHVHAKDFHFKTGQEPDPGEGWFATRGQNRLRGAIVGHGVVPVGQCLRILRESRYDGSISLEFEGLEDPVLGLKIGLANLRNYLGE